MKCRQLDLFSHIFNMLPRENVIYAIDILRKLYYEKSGMNISEINAFFQNKNRTIVRNTINELEKINYIRLLNNNPKEKRYIITEDGKCQIEEWFSMNAKNFK